MSRPPAPPDSGPVWFGCSPQEGARPLSPAGDIEDSLTTRAWVPTVRALPGRLLTQFLIDHRGPSASVDIVRGSTVTERDSWSAAVRSTIYGRVGTTGRLTSSLLDLS